MNREMMQQELMDLGVWLSEHPREARKNLRAVRSAKVLEPGVYFNRGTGMVDRIFSSQRVALGHQTFRISHDPAAPDILGLQLELRFDQREDHTCGS